MIKLLFTVNREMMHFIVLEKNIYYTDRKWQGWLRCLPKPENFINTINLSRNRLPAFLVNLFKYSEEELKEYESIEGEEQIADLVVRDAKLKGCKLLARVNTEMTPEIKTMIEKAEIVAGGKKI